MSKKVRGILPIGRYQDIGSGKSYNMYKATVVGRGTTVIFYYRSGKRVIIPDNEFYSGRYKPLSTYANT